MHYRWHDISRTQRPRRVQLKHSKEKKLVLLRSFGWQEEKGPDNLTTSERQDKAIQSLTTQARPLPHTPHAVYIATPAAV